jgi:hypothetical protein
MHAKLSLPTFASFLLLACMYASSSWAARPVRVLVAPVASDEDPGSAATLSHEIETSVREASADLDVVTTSAIDTKVALGCLTGDDTSCIVELADSAGVDAVIRSHLGHVGRETVLTLAVIDGKHASVLAQSSRRVAANNTAHLLDELPGLAAEVLHKAGLVSRPIAIPVTLTVVGGVVLAGAALGVVASTLWTLDYNNAKLTRDDAKTFESLAPVAWIGAIAGVALGATATTIGIVGLVGE